MAVTRKGAFLPTYIGFTGKTAKEQAEEILAQVDFYWQQGYTKVGITYSANNDQVVDQILPTYKPYVKGKWKTGVSGSNQAEVMAAVETLLATNKYKHLQDVFRIIPITTCAHSGGSGAVRQVWLERDLENMEEFIKKEQGLVFGWQNEAANDKTDKKYAIGGSISKQLSSTLVPGTKKTQDSFVQEEIGKLATKHPTQLDLNIYAASTKPKPTSTKKPTPSTTASASSTSTPAKAKPELEPKAEPKVKPKKKKVTFKLEPEMEPKAKPIIKSLSSTPSTLFAHTRPKPDSDEVIVSSKAIADQVRAKDKIGVKADTDFIIRKGNLKGTFKVAFKDADAAKTFHEHLLKLGYDKDETTYFGKHEAYRLDELGRVDEKGEYRFIVRFEVPENALNYLQSIKANNAKELYEAVMVDKAPKKDLKL